MGFMTKDEKKKHRVTKQIETSLILKFFNQSERSSISAAMTDVDFVKALNMQVKFVTRNNRTGISVP